MYHICSMDIKQKTLTSEEYNFMDKQYENLHVIQIYCARKVLFISPGLADFPEGLVVSVCNLPYGQVKFFGNFLGKFKHSSTCTVRETFVGLVRMIFEVVQHRMLGLARNFFLHPVDCYTVYTRMDPILIYGLLDSGVSLKCKK